MKINFLVLSLLVLLNTAVYGENARVVHSIQNKVYLTKISLAGIVSTNCLQCRNETSIKLNLRAQTGCGNKFAETWDNNFVLSIIELGDVGDRGDGSGDGCISTLEYLWSPISYNNLKEGESEIASLTFRDFKVTAKITGGQTEEGKFTLIYSDIKIKETF